MPRLLGAVFAALLISVMSVFAGYGSISYAHAAMKRGYVDVGVKRCRTCSDSEWKARHTRAESPWRFYASAFRWLWWAIFLGCFALAVWIGIIWKQPLPERIPLLWLQQTVLVACIASASLALLFWWPLK